MSDPVPLELLALEEVLERVSALEPGGSREAGATRAIERGVCLLDSAEGRAGPDLESIVERARFDLLRHRALVLSETNRRLEQSVYELATESRELHDRLWEWSQRADRLKVKLGRREQVRPRPEPPLTIGLGRPRRERRGSADRLLEGLRLEPIELHLPADVVARAEALTERPGWPEGWEEDALAVVLAYGLASVELERAGVAGSDLSRPAAAPQALEALRYRVFELSESIRILTIRETALRIDNRGMRLRLAQYEPEVSALEQELAQRGEAPRARKPGWLGRLRRMADRG
jgi:hypothetical protein